MAPRLDDGSGRTLLPVRYAAQAMNASVFWNEEGQKITIVHNESQRVLELAVGDTSMRVGDSEDEFSDVALDQAPVVDPPGRTMLPIRAVAEALYGQVSWDPDTQRIIIVRPATRQPSAEPAPAEVDFGSMLPMNPEEPDHNGEHVKSVLITNRGAGPLFVDDVSLAKGAAFTLCDRQFQAFMLRPGEARQVFVCVVARQPGGYDDTLTFHSRVEVPTDLIISPVHIFIRLLGCKVTIAGGGQRPNLATSGSAPLPMAGYDKPVVNVGQAMDLQAVVSGLWGPFSYQWTVTGAHIKDYQELTTAPWSTTPMAPADYQNANLAYYWKATGAQSVTVLVTDRLGSTCTATERFTVERNAADANRQAEDFYTWNHTSRVLVEHRTWHAVNPYMPCMAVGTPFYTFHHSYIDRFQSWRREFGYGPATVWNPGTPLPGGVANVHAARGGVYNPLVNQVPTYLTPGGGMLASPCNGAKKKADFPSANAFWMEVQGPWHNNVHVRIGGDMAGVSTAPKDPIFWRFHLYVDGL